MNKEVEEKIKSKDKLMKEHFIQFLKEKRLYSKFARELRKDSGITVSAYLKYFLDGSYDKYMYMTGAFYWSNSNDGHKFWSKVCEEWLDFSIDTSYE